MIKLFCKKHEVEAAFRPLQSKGVETAYGELSCPEGHVELTKDLRRDAAFDVFEWRDVKPKPQRLSDLMESPEFTAGERSLIFAADALLTQALAKHNLWICATSHPIFEEEKA